MTTTGSVVLLRRYPVKSMLGEELAELTLESGGVVGDRTLALLDESTGRIATAKHPRRWRRLLQCAATRSDDAVLITLPDGDQIDAADPDIDERLSKLLEQPVRLIGTRPAGAEVERPDPEDVIAQGVEADVPFATLEIAQGSPGGTFVDYAPAHLITTATVQHLGVEVLRYRPNLLIDADVAPYAENDWVGREIRVGEVVLRGILTTPRCSVPTLEHGDLPRAVQAVRPLLDENRIDVPGFGVLPCAGVYVEVVSGGTVRPGDRVEIAG